MSGNRLETILRNIAELEFELNNYTCEKIGSVLAGLLITDPRLRRSEFLNELLVGAVLADDDDDDDDEELNK